MAVNICTNPGTIADLQAGDEAALWRDSTTLVRILHVEPAARGCMRVEWDHGPCSKVTVRIMPSTNPVQIAWRSS